MLWGHGLNDYLCGLLVVDLSDDLLCGKSKWHPIVDDPHSMLCRAPLSEESCPSQMSDKTDTQPLEVDSVLTLTTIDEKLGEFDFVHCDTPSQSHLEASKRDTKSGSHLCHVPEFNDSMCCAGQCYNSCVNSTNSNATYSASVPKIGKQMPRPERDRLGPGQLLTVNKRSMSGE